jgi:hypothetical protein
VLALRNERAWPRAQGLRRMDFGRDRSGGAVR